MSSKCCSCDKWALCLSPDSEYVFCTCLRAGLSWIWSCRAEAFFGDSLLTYLSPGIVIVWAILLNCTSSHSCPSRFFVPCNTSSQTWRQPLAFRSKMRYVAFQEGRWFLWRKETWKRTGFGHWAQATAKAHTFLSWPAVPWNSKPYRKEGNVNSDN